MKKTILYSLFFIMCAVPAMAAVAIKKAAPVATQGSAGTSGAASLVPSVIGLVSGVIEMNAKQNALSLDCIPSTTEMTFVDNTMKEWAKTGQMTAEQVRALLKREPCGRTDCYATDAEFMNAAGMVPRYNEFRGAGNDGMVWEGFPKTGKGTFCKDGTGTCAAKDQETVTDTYDLFNIIDFGPADYLPAEATMAARLLNRVEDCSSGKISAKKKALWGEFLINTAGSLGQSTNTGTIMESVGQIAGSRNAGGAMGSIGAIASQFLAK
jgi:hypothetical protein